MYLDKCGPSSPPSPGQKKREEQYGENLKKVFGSWVVELISGKLDPIKSGLREWHTAIMLITGLSL